MRPERLTTGSPLHAADYADQRTEGSHQRMVSLMECVTCKKCLGEPKPQRDEKGFWQIICRGCGWKTEPFHNPWIAADSWNGHQTNAEVNHAARGKRNEKPENDAGGVGLH